MNTINRDQIFLALLAIASVSIGWLLGFSHTRDDIRQLNKKEWPCTMPVIINGEPDCVTYQRFQKEEIK